MLLDDLQIMLTISGYEVGRVGTGMLTFSQIITDGRYGGGYHRHVNHGDVITAGTNWGKVTFYPGTETIPFIRHKMIDEIFSFIQENKK